jgi:hypothetical protein
MQKHTAELLACTGFGFRVCGLAIKVTKLWHEKLRLHCDNAQTSLVLYAGGFVLYVSCCILTPHRPRSCCMMAVSCFESSCHT